jgi:hypothetical protein
MLSIVACGLQTTDPGPVFTVAIGAALQGFAGCFSCRPQLSSASGVCICRGDIKLAAPQKKHSRELSNASH